MPDRSFPPGFLFGTATAAHQIEGGNWNNDWWDWEHRPGTPCVEPSGDACDSYHRYAEDIDIVAGLGLDTYRFSIEWSRIEPEDGEWSRAALDHYRRVLAACHERGVQPVVTFHHFTTPRWVAARGGWIEPSTADLFARFCERSTAHLGDLISAACTINEPNMPATIGYLAGTFPPGERSPDLRRRANDVFIDAHGKALDAIKAGPGDAPVGMTLAMQELQAVDGGEERRARILRNLEDVYLDAAAGDDFLGVQTYTRTRVGPEGTRPPEEGARTTLMGYELWPEALEACIRRAWEATGSTPIIVTENGIATDHDEERVEYVGRALSGVLRCIDDGIDVRGYTYWSLLDNFEWAHGYGPTFGLVAVDRQTFERRVKPSARWLGEVAQVRALPADAAAP